MECLAHEQNDDEDVAALVPNYHAPNTSALQPQYSVTAASSFPTAISTCHSVNPPLYACVGNRATVRNRADSRTRDHMACAQARTIRVRAAALPSESLNHEPPPLQQLLLDSTLPLPNQQLVERSPAISSHI